MAAALVLWSHALAALLFAGVAVWAHGRPLPGLPRGAILAAFALSAIWALSVAGLGGGDPAARLVDGARNVALLALMFALHRRSEGAAPVGLIPLYGVVALVAAAGAGLQVVTVALPDGQASAALASTAILLRMLVAVAALMLAQAIHASAGRGDVRLLALAVAAMWLGDLTIATAAYLAGRWQPEVAVLRGAAVAVGAALAGIALQRGAHAPLRVSRAVAWQSLSLAALGAYLGLLALGTSALGSIGGGYARLLQTAFVIGSATAVLTLLSTPWLRACARVLLAKHFFRHRYDYRAEWLRFIETLAAPDGDAPLAQRVAKAIADLTESPGGLLLVRDGEALSLAAHWSWRDLPRSGALSAGFVAHVEQDSRIVEIDPLRTGAGAAADRAHIPAWLFDAQDAWAIVPLVHVDRLVGAVVLARPALPRALDWEDFDLLKVAGRQAASHLAEARAQDALAEANRFEEFNRRFAFIVHDIKNLVSGLTLVARNAERHADNPAFRADMVATLQDSATKLTGLLARLTPSQPGPSEAAAAIDLLPLARRIAAARRASHPVTVTGSDDVCALAQPGRLEQILAHLVQNAIEASGTTPVAIAVGTRDGHATIAVVDQGCGMSPAFVRDQLFRPFASSKPGGFGIGAFEARQLTQAMGGRIEVESAEGAGSTFRIVLPLATPERLSHAA